MCNYNLNGRRRSKRPNGNTHAKKIGSLITSKREFMEKTISEYKNKIEDFATKPAFVFIVCAAAFFFHAFALDLVGLILFALTGGAFLIAFKDVRPSLTVIFFAIFVVSTQNSTWPKGVSDFYFRTSTIITLVICGAILIACMVFRCVKHKENYRGAKSILPLAALSLSMILSGEIGRAHV